MVVQENRFTCLIPTKVNIIIEQTKIDIDTEPLDVESLNSKDEKTHENPSITT